MLVMQQWTRWIRSQDESDLEASPLGNLGAKKGVSLIRDVKDTVYPLFESDTSFLECLCVLFLFV